MRNYQVTPEQIITELYNIFSDERRAREYTQQTNPQYLGLCGWAGPMSPMNRPAFVDAFGLDTIEAAERIARARVAAYRAAYDASHYHRHEIEANEADPDQVPAVGSFVWCFGDGLKCEGGPMDSLKNHCQEWDEFRPELVEICAVETVAPAALLDAATAHELAAKHQHTTGGSRWNEADPLRLDGLPYAWTAGLLVTDGARWYVINGEGYNYARYILQPLTVADMYAPEINSIRQELDRAAAEEAARLQAEADERRRQYLDRCARWEGAGLVDVRPLIAAESAAYGTREKSQIRSASAKLSAARRKNIAALIAAAFPGVKFSIRANNGWGAAYRISWTDGPTVETFRASTDVDLLFTTGEYYSNQDDSYDYDRKEFTDFAEKFMGFTRGGFDCDRHESQEFRDEIAARIREAVPGLPESDQAQIPEADALEVAEAADIISGDRAHRSRVVDMAERWGLLDVVAYVARITDRPTTSEAPTDPTPDNGGTGAAYGVSEKSQNQEAPDGLTLEEIPGGVAVVGDSRATYKARRDIKAHGARWNKAAQRWEATSPEAVESLRQWLTPAPVADATPTEEAAPVAYGPAEKSQTRTPEAEAINAALVVVEGNIMRNLAFINDGGQLVTNPGTAALLHPSRGFVVMPDDDGTPYTPLGGAEALREILQAGGFLNFEGFRFVWPVDFDAPAMARLMAAYGMPQKSQICEATAAAAELEAEMMAEAIAHHVRLKQQHPDALLLLRCGDFYELWLSDAEIGADVLRLTLTRRPDGVPICAFPYMALDTYLPKLVRAGHRVAICDDLRTKRRPSHQEATA